jgi:hypothetical protein
MRSLKQTVVSLGLAALAFTYTTSTARAVNEPAIERGVAFLRARGPGGPVGEAALAALAMLKADVPATDPAVAACLTKIRSRFSSGGYQPEKQGGHDVYEAAVVALVLSNLDAEARRSDLATVAQYLIGRQMTNGAWDYTHRTAGDASISQYAVLGLWEAENAGADVPPEVWDRAASWYVSNQSADGGWNYHPDERVRFPDTISMTAAGVGSLLICQRQLGRYRQGIEGLSPLLTPLTVAEKRLRYSAGTSAAKVREAIRRGMGWIGSRFSTAKGPLIGQSLYYGLYGIERIGALADKDTIGRLDWFEQGRQAILRGQAGDGSWNSEYNQVPNTSWAVLFLTRSTRKTIRRITVKQLGAGTLQGGRGLPEDMSNLTVAGGRVISRPMNGAVDGMLAVLEDPRATNADAALSGLVLRYRTEGPAALRPHKDRFRKLAADRDPGLRRVAVWALARTGDLDAAPVLIDRLTDPDEQVVGVARDGLQLLSRKIDGLGPPSPSTPDQRREAAARWRAWYAATRPLDLEGLDVATPPAPGSLPTR